jgi:membrane protein implicated in regulation of membrane protease activity
MGSMASENELKSLYETQLKGRLAALEVSRKRIFGRYFFTILLVAVLAAGNYLVVSTVPYPAVMVLSILVSVALLIYYVYITFQEQKQYRKAFKTGVVAELVKLIDPEWQYLCDQCIGEDTYQISGLFPHRYDRYMGDDFVIGQIGKTDFQFSELHTEYKQVTYGSKGQRHEQWITIFRGVFLHADFNKNFAGTTFVLPDTAERLLGALGQSLQKLSNRGELIKLENIEFEKLFVVYSSDQVESRYILTPAIMEAMVDLHRRFDGDLYFSFVGSRVYFAKGFSTALFEPNILRSGVNFSDVKEMFDLFGMISALVQELNLNTRIWTKE